MFYLGIDIGPTYGNLDNKLSFSLNGIYVGSLLYLSQDSPFGQIDELVYPAILFFNGFVLATDDVAQMAYSRHQHLRILIDIDVAYHVVVTSHVVYGIINFAVEEFVN